MRPAPIACRDFSRGYTVLRVAKPGFGVKLYERFPVTVNRVLTFDVELPVSRVQEEIRISASPSLLDTHVSSSGSTIPPEQIDDMPINGRNYLDLMQLVPGVAINRQRDVGTDLSAPILGERGGNAVFLIDGMPNSNLVLASVGLYGLSHLQWLSEFTTLGFAWPLGAQQQCCVDRYA